MIMIINAAVHYACLAMLDLAIHRDDPGPVRAAEIAARNSIPGPYLTQIMRTLRSTGWIRTIRGSQGGYQLAVDPESITLLAIADAIGCGDHNEPGGGGDHPAELELRQCWHDATASARRQLSKVRLSDLATRCHRSDEAMFYI